MSLMNNPEGNYRPAGDRTVLMRGRFRPGFEIVHAVFQRPPCTRAGSRGSPTWRPRAESGAVWDRVAFSAVQFFRIRCVQRRIRRDPQEWGCSSMASTPWPARTWLPWFVRQENRCCTGFRTPDPASLLSRRRSSLPRGRTSRGYTRAESIVRWATLRAITQRRHSSWT